MGLRIFLSVGLGVNLMLVSAAGWAGGTDPQGNDDANRKIVKSGVLGAATGAIASGASGGEAGKGALIGAGTNVIGGALLDSLTAPSQPQQPAYYPPPQQGYAQQGYQQTQQGYAPQGYYQDPPRQPVYAAPPPPRQDGGQKVLKQGLLGAGTGAIAAGASGGEAGTGALVGAGTNIIGGVLLDALSTPSQPQQPVYYPPPPQQQPYYQGQAQPQSGAQPKKRILRKYDAEGNIISEEEIYE